MKDIACSGYTLKASDLTKTLPKSIQPDYEKYISEGDNESVETLLGDNLPSSFPSVESVFVVNAEMGSEDWEEGEMIVTFADEDLFTRSKTPELKALEKANINPQFTRWTVWC